jgi:hypothetical protein
MNEKLRQQYDELKELQYKIAQAIEHNELAQKDAIRSMHILKGVHLDLCTIKDYLETTIEKLLEDNTG